MNQQPTVNNASFVPTLQVGAGKLKQLLWYYCNLIFFMSGWMFSSRIKAKLLRLFGAQVGQGLVIKPGVNIKYPWKLRIGDHCWIGENVWIDNLAMVQMGDHACISQGALLLTGNHNFKKTTFDLITQPIIIENGAWIGAKSVVCPGVTCGSHAVLTVSSVATSNLLPYTIYKGNPAIVVGTRNISA